MSFGLACPCDIMMTTKTRMPAKKVRLINRMNLSLGSPIFSASLPKAIILPANETLPITRPRRIARLWPLNMPCFSISSGAILGNSIREIKAAAAPPIPLKNDTSCGMAVILTLTAMVHPITVPIRMAARIRPIFPIGSPSLR